MEENLSPDQETEFVANDILNEWLGELRFTARLVADIDDALAILAAKRTTLEEKMIAKELHALVAFYGEIISQTHRRLADAQQPPAERLEELRTLNFAVHEEIDRLLKALRYNLNYVEQYFEFGFCNRLREECKFTEQAEKLSAQLRI